MLVNPLARGANWIAGTYRTRSARQVVRSLVPAWGVVLAANLLALLLTLVLTPHIEPGPFPLFAIAIALSTKYAGVLGSVVSVLFATLVTNYFFLPPFYSVSLGPEDLSRLSLFTFVGVIVSVNAFRQRRAAQTAFQLAAIVESSEDAIIGKRLDGIIVSWNAAAERLFGYSADEIIGRSGLIIVPPHRHAETTAFLQSIRQGQRVAHFETERLTKSGQVVNISLSLSPIRDQARTIVGSSAIERDITQGRRAEVAVTQLSSAVEQIDDSVIITNREGIIEYVNPAFERLTGYARAEAIGNTPALLKSGRQGQEFYAQLWNCILSGQVFRAEMVNRKKNGEFYYEAKTITPIKDNTGQIIHFVSTGKDITERVRAYEILEQKMQERTREVTQLYEQADQRNRETAALEERQRLARELHDSVTQSLYSLTLLVEAGKRMAAAGDLPQVRHNLVRLSDTAQQALKEMRLLVYQLRPPELETRGLVGALQHRLDVVERHAGIQVSLQAEGRIDMPAAFEEELYRITLEALNNSLKHAHATSTSVRFQVISDTAEITIEDDGRGFDPSLAGERGGMGLGNMHERARRLGGELDVRSTDGQGTRITVRVRIPHDPHMQAPQGEKDQ